MTEFRRYAFRAGVKAKKLQIGLWQSLCSNIAAESCSDSGFDWLLLDTEHSPNELPDLLSQLQALELGAATPIVRPAWNDAVLIKRSLDIGAQTLLIPYVQNAGGGQGGGRGDALSAEGHAWRLGAARAPRATAACRTISPRLNDEICVLVQVETRAGARSDRSDCRGGTASTVCSSARPTSRRRSAISATPAPRRAGRAEGCGRAAERSRQAGRHPNRQ